MKRAILSVVILLGATFFLYSQIEKGTVMVGGNAGFQFKATNNYTKEFTFSVAPNALYSAIKQLAFGGQISYSFYSHKDSDPLQPYPIVNEANSFSIGPAIRTNIHIGGKTFFFFHASPSFGIQSMSRPSGSDKIVDSYSIITWRLGPGVSIFATKNLAIELGVFYDGMKQVHSVKLNKALVTKYSTLFTHGLTVAIGLQFYVHKKPKASAGNL